MFNLIPKAYAQVDISGLSYPGQKIADINKLNIGDLLTKLKVFPLVFFLAGLIFFFNLLYAAWDYILSSGDAKKIAGATSRILNAFVGIVIVLASFIIVRIILAILGLQDLMSVV